jgi:hypothetical protein
MVAELRRPAGVSGNVLAMTVFDEGAGPALCSGGSFTSAGGLEVQKHRALGRHALVGAR